MAETVEVIPTPEWWVGTGPEYLCWQALLKLGLKPDIDFSYQSQLAGGRMQKGGRVVDFEIYNPPDIAINVQGLFFHYEKGAAVRQSDILTREYLATLGIQLIFVDEDDLIENARAIVADALAGIDRSRFS
jgi:hypothetical protein|tara:strand:+ start:994 stop:1386 length:393 start_codon:yes stop_codon:yes gene_type:complete